MVEVKLWEGLKLVSSERGVEAVTSGVLLVVLLVVVEVTGLVSVGAGGVLEGTLPIKAAKR